MINTEIVATTILIASPTEAYFHKLLYNFKTKYMITLEPIAIILYGRYFRDLEHAMNDKIII